METTRKDTPKEVAFNLKRFLRQRGTLQDAAASLGVGPTTISNQLNGEKYFTRKTAERYAAYFNVNADYLVTGEGELVPNFELPRHIFPIAPVANSIEERIGKSVVEQVKKLNEIAHTYNSLVEHIKETAGYLEEGAEWYNVCQKAIKRLDGIHIDSILLFDDVRDINVI